MTFLLEFKCAMLMFAMQIAGQDKIITAVTNVSTFCKALLIPIMIAAVVINAILYMVGNDAAKQLTWKITGGVIVLVVGLAFILPLVENFMATSQY